jgi:hypothetical protein
MDNINLENLYRGNIQSNKRFYLAARINNNTAGASASIKNGLALTNDNSHFLLCLNNLEKSGINYHHFYWSNDPVDFVPQLEFNSRNQGAVKLFYKNDVIYDYQFVYQTNLNSQNYNNNLTYYEVSNLVDDVEIKPTQCKNYRINPENSKNYNISNLIHSGVAYDLTDTFDNTINWNFRANISSSSGGSFRPDIATFNNNNNVFENLAAKSVRITGTPPVVNEIQMSTNGFTAVTNYLGASEIPLNGGIATMSQSGNKETFSFSHYDSSSGFITFNERAMFGGTSFTPSTSVSLTLTVVLSNHINNFKNLKDLIGSSYSINTNYLDIFFIPVTNDSFLTGGHHLESINNYELTSSSVEFYNYVNGEKFFNGNNNRALSFFSNYLNNTLPANFSTSKMDNNYPLIPVYSKSTDTASSSTLLWTTRYESINSYKYNYCRGEDICGNCMGLTETRGYFCHTNHKTIDNYKNSTPVGNDNSLGAMTPLSQNSKDSQSDNIFHNFTIPLVTISAVGGLTIIIIIFIIANRVSRQREFEQILSKIED